MPSQDKAIIQTADKALQAKLSCVQKNYYYHDPFLSPMSHGVADASSRTNTNPIMEPIIRRGTHARVQVMDRAIQAFLSLDLNTAERQIVLLGSGRDTTYLRYRLGHLNTITRQSLQQRQVVRWYEVDHSTVICQKVYDSNIIDCNINDATRKGFINNSFFLRRPRSNIQQKIFVILDRDKFLTLNCLFFVAQTKQHYLSSSWHVIDVLFCLQSGQLFFNKFDHIMGPLHPDFPTLIIFTYLSLFLFRDLLVPPSTLSLRIVSNISGVGL